MSGFKIGIVGAGPAGLYFALQAKKRDPSEIEFGRPFEGLSEFSSCDLIVGAGGVNLAVRSSVRSSVLPLLLPRTATHGMGPTCCLII